MIYEYKKKNCLRNIFKGIKITNKYLTKDFLFDIINQIIMNIKIFTFWKEIKMKFILYVKKNFIILLKFLKILIWKKNVIILLTKLIMKVIVLIQVITSKSFW